MRNGSSRSPPQTLPFSVQPYLLPLEYVSEQLQSDLDSGLSKDQVESRQQQYGPNAVPLIRP
jgi:hypothetical protein